MRLKDNEIDLVSKHITNKICREDTVELKISKGEFLELIKKAITEDLMIEDNLNREVEEILRGHMEAIQGGSVDYRRLFAMIKSKLAKERNLIIS